MKKMLSLLKATFSEGMAIFKLKGRYTSPFIQKILPFVLAVVLVASLTSYTNMIAKPLSKVGLTYVILVLFTFMTFFLTIVEGIYKSGDLILKCKDDDLLLSLPIKKSIILWIRIIKFYIFELLYNLIFMLPAIISYATYEKPGVVFYIISFIMILMLPILPIVISILIGFAISTLASKFKFKNLMTIVFSMLLLVGVLGMSLYFDNIIKALVKNATSLLDLIKKIYYPAYLYSDLINNFSIIKLGIYVLCNIILVCLVIGLLSKLYFKVNSRLQEVSIITHNKKYKIRKQLPMISLIKKEFKRNFSSSVFVINACFGLVLYLISCILLSSKVSIFIKSASKMGLNLSVGTISKYIPLVLIGLISIAAFTTSMTSSLISLEGKNFNMLKTLPIKPSKILSAKLYMALTIMLPIILIGDVIIYYHFDIGFYNFMLCLVCSFTFPLVSQKLGLLLNILYPNMDALNDTEVVKESFSVMVSVFAGFGFIILIGTIIYIGFKFTLTLKTITFIITVLFLVLYLIISILLNTIGEKKFVEITS